MENETLNLKNEKKEQTWFPSIFSIILLIAIISWSGTISNRANIVNPGDNKLNNANVPKTGYTLYDTAVAKILPIKGFQSKIILGGSIVKLIENGVIDKNKFEAIYKARGGLPDELKDTLIGPSNNPILLTRNNANIYVNLLWPVGLSNYMLSNEKSPVNGKSLYNFASTGGWNLGKEKNGGAYFNKFKIMELTPEQEALVLKIAENSYRPCCNNSTFFQDCNHGSALLGLLELGASQGLTEGELWREALVFNSFWFPSTYIETALYFKVVKNVDWENVDPKVVIGKEFSSASGSVKIQAEVAKIPNLFPPVSNTGGGSCGT